MEDSEPLAMLKAGVDIWNAWREEEHGLVIQLSGSNLKEANLYGADLREAELRAAILIRSSLGGANLSGADLYGADLTGAYLEEAILRETTLREAELREANLGGADLREADLRDANMGETNLYAADLSGANLSGAILDGADLYAADLSRANLREANLSRANLREANLSGADLREADMFGTDLSQFNLSGFNLSQAYLREADLREANLGQVNLSEANLRDVNLRGADLSGANLSGADLSRTQALSANFQSALFTGACLKDWNINSSTNLEGVQVDYIYQNIDEKGEFCDRRPHSGNFKPGEFVALFQQALDTIDLIFIGGIDWQAFFNSFQKLRQKYDDAELNIQAIEKKSCDSFVVRLEVPEEIDKAAIEQAAKASYEQQLQRIETCYQAQLQLKDVEIESHKRESANMLEITKLLASKPITVEANAVADSKSLNQTNHGGINFQNDISGGEVNQADTINVDRTSITTNAQGATIGNFANQMSDNASQTYNAAPDKSLAEAAQEIQTLLDQLSRTYPSETMLQKAQFADAAATQAKANPTLRQRLLSAVDAGTMGALEEMLSHPVATFFIAAVKDWEETKPSA